MNADSEGDSVVTATEDAVVALLACDRSAMKTAVASMSDEELTGWRRAITAMACQVSFEQLHRGNVRRANAPWRQGAHDLRQRQS